MIRLIHMAHQTTRQTSFARRLRKHDSEVERRLWERLRASRLNGQKFMRQLPVGNYVVDFACRSKQLVVEVDGATHSDANNIAYDVRRTAFLEQLGWRVLRVENMAVFTELNAVCDLIVQTLEEEI